MSNSTARTRHVTLTSLTLEQRREILSNHITKYIKAGYRVLAQTDTTAQLVKPKHFSCFWATVFLLLSVLLIGLVLIAIYLFIYMAQKDQTIYVEVDSNGKVTEIRK